MFGVERIGNFNVRKMSDGKYAVTTTIPGNCAACVVDEEGLKKIREKYNRQQDTFESRKKSNLEDAYQFILNNSQEATRAIVDPVGYAEDHNVIKTFAQLHSDISKLLS